VPFKTSYALRLIVVIFCAFTLASCQSSSDTADDASRYGVGNIAPGSPQDFAVNVGDRVFFQQDQSDISAVGQATLNKQAQWLRAYPRYTVMIEGHADERGTRDYNFALGERRATALHDYLVAEGINGQRIRTISYGKERPVAVCDDESCWSQNRRAVTVLDTNRRTS
jgi:peptidoglycan-associated lipoprotein